MEKGFFHAQRGYWQTISTPPQHILDSYPEGTVEVPLKPGAGYAWIDGQWAEVPVTTPVPQLVSRFQAKGALMQAGLLAQVEAAVAQADPFIQLAWAEAKDFRRDSPAIASISAGLGLTDEQVDDLFRAAALIEA